MTWNWYLIWPGDHKFLNSQIFVLKSILLAPKIVLIIKSYMKNGEIQIKSMYLEQRVQVWAWSLYTQLYILQLVYHWQGLFEPGPCVLGLGPGTHSFWCPGAAEAGVGLCLRPESATCWWIYPELAPSWQQTKNTNNIGHWIRSPRSSTVKVSVLTHKAIIDHL